MRVSRSAIALAVAGVLVAAFAVFAVVSGQREQQQARDQASDAPPLAAPESNVPEQAGAPEVVAALEKVDRPFTMAVLGDSTGADGDSWTYLTAVALAEKYDRPLVAHGWVERDSTGKTAYYQDYPDYLGNAATTDNAPIELWNGSAPNRGPDYSLELLDTFIPAKKVDWVVINHGHNVPLGTGDINTERLVDGVEERWPDAVIMGTRENPQLKSSGHRDEQEQEVREIAYTFERLGYTVIDVRSLFAEKGRKLTQQLEDPVHPTPAGYKRWSDLVLDTLFA